MEIGCDIMVGMQELQKRLESLEQDFSKVYERLKIDEKLKRNGYKKEGIVCFEELKMSFAFFFHFHFNKISFLNKK